ncbi:MAG TPA: DUF6519 domain-containing protein [Puia sp.]
MPGDYSRRSFEREKHYSGVLMQQGRVQLDADWNEQWDIQQHRTRKETIDVIGSTGVPKKGESFLIAISPGGTDLLILPGRIYVDGLLFELEKDSGPTSYFYQPYYPQPDGSYFLSGLPDAPFSPPDSPPAETGSLGLKDGTYLAYLEGWQREITWLEDAHIHEVALGEVDTATRIQNVWQVKLLRVQPKTGGKIKCDSYFPEWQQLIAPGTGTLKARTNPAPDPTTPCCLPPEAGYTGVENQLYRVEVQTKGTAATATFKWSRENASVATKILDIDTNILTVADLGKDTVLGFLPGQWVEIVDETSELLGIPNPLVQIEKLGATPNTLVLTTDAGIYAGRPNRRLRRWDQSVSTATSAGLTMTGGWIELEDGIQVYFGDGNYKAGDYWLIPARTATAAIEWPRYPGTDMSIPRPPVGTRHHYCRLALLEAGNSQVVITDCRPLFPSLTGICAEDICFDNNNCLLPGADNVQEALDMLCASNNLREHNKYLHGFGVVCGLTVNCGDDRSKIKVNQGYALDCEGNPIKLSKELSYDLISNAAAINVQEGKVCLVLSGTSAAPVLSVENYTPESFWEEVLDGTLIKDFYDKYILDFINFAKKQLGLPLKDIAPVPIEQRTLTALINILAQTFNPASGKYVFISGNKKQRSCDPAGRDTTTEDELLYCLFTQLRTVIGGKTFCGMFDGDKGFPDYNIDPGLSTIFGTPLRTHHRLRISVDGKFLYTCGLDNRICIYNTDTGQLVQVLEDLANTGITFQDIATVPNDIGHIHVVGIVNNLHSVFVVITRNAAGSHAWGNSATVNNVLCVRLAYSPSKHTPYGIFKSQGLFDLTGLGSPAFQQKLVGAGLNATGLMAFGPEDTTILISINASTAVATTAFTHLKYIRSAGQPSPDCPFTGDAFNDDLLVYREFFYITGTSGGRVLGKLPVNNSSNIAPASTPLENSSVIRLAVPQKQTSNYILVTLSDACKVVLTDLHAFKVVPRWRIPVQLFPMGIVFGSEDKIGYVLNTTCNTITAIEFSVLLKSFSSSPFSGKQPNFTVEPPAVLATYHAGVLNAYKELFGHLLQYLKDSFCGQYLIDCPACGPNEKIYLGCVEIRNGMVYHICNFTKRKYVKTFRTVDYWMSTVPILPMISTAFKRFCCTVLNKK